MTGSKNKAYVFIVNGFPRSGKDTFVNAAKKQWEAMGGTAVSYSSIDPIFNILANSKLIDPANRHNLSNNERCALAEVGDILEKRFKFKTDSALKFIADSYAAAQKHLAIFMFVREPAVIKVLSNIINEYSPDITVTSILVGRKNSIKDIENSSDQQVLFHNYSFVIANNDSLEDFMTRTRLFITSVYVSINNKEP